MPRVLIIGNGRAGGSFGAALAAAGWIVDPPLGRGDAVSGAARGVDAVLIATPDAAVADVAAAIDPVGEAVVMHVAGSLTLDALAPHRRRASVHPLLPLPDPLTGAERLASGGWFAVAGSGPDELAVARGLVDDLGGHAAMVADADRARYHAAACIAANHLVALLGQVDRVAASVGVPLDAYLELARASFEDVAAVGPVAALTGPVARRDWGTVAAHLDALPVGERETYRALALAAFRLVAEPGEGPPAVLGGR